MRKSLRVVFIVMAVLIALFACIAALVYFQVDTRVTMEDPLLPAPANNITIQRLDSTTLTADSITRQIETIVKDAQIAGLAVAIVNNGEVVYQRYFGERNKSRRDPFAPGTIVYAASFSKTMLADISVQLHDEGKIHLDTPLFKYLPRPLTNYRTSTLKQLFGGDHHDYRDLQGDDRYKKITARMCLMHTTGLPNWRWIEPDGKLKFKFNPGERYSYSGEGMFLLQLVLEEITGMTFEELATERIFVPLQLSRSSFVWQRGYEGQYAVGHDANGNITGIPKRNMSNAAGSLSTTIEEYTRYFTKVLSMVDPRYEQMTTSHVAIRSRQQFGPNAQVETSDNNAIELGYGLGYGVYRTPYGRVFFKEGHDAGWQHYAVGFPDSQTALILMSNSDNAEKTFKQLIELTTGNQHTPWYWEGYLPDER